LGFWEDPGNGGTPLNSSHQVGLWNSGGTLLASGTVLFNSPLTGNWRYLAITPVTLTAGQSYVVGSAIQSPFTDTFSRVDLPAGTVTTNSLIAVNGAVENAFAGGFSFPATTLVSIGIGLGVLVLKMSRAATSNL
jgi:hypothetical protein